MKAPSKAKLEAGSIEITAKDWHQPERNNFWYVGVGLLVLVAAYLGFISRDYLGMAVAITVGIAVYRVAHFKPDTRKIRLTSQGIDWGGRFRPYHQFRAFWLANIDDRITVYIERLNWAPAISFIISSSETEKIATYLAGHLPWHEHKSEPLGDRFSRLLRL